MRIITWNCNMAFRKKYQQILPFKPDLLVLQECEHIDKLNDALEAMDYYQIIWHGINLHKGLAIISFNNIDIELASDFNQDFDFVLPIKFKPKQKWVNLFNVWAMPNKVQPSKSYVGQIWSAANYYKATLRQASIWIGDFNSNAIWDKQRRVGNHSDVVKLFNANEIESIYHKQFEIEHGQERHPTLYLLKKKEKPYHMDYCFLSNTLMNDKTKIKIGHYENWIKWSDHMPLIIEGVN